LEIVFVSAGTWVPIGLSLCSDFNYFIQLKHVNLMHL